MNKKKFNSKLFRSFLKNYGVEVKHEIVDSIGSKMKTLVIKPKYLYTDKQGRNVWLDAT